VNSGRNALRLYLREKKIKDLFIPSYICDSVIQAIQKENASIQFYNIKENFEPILSKNTNDRSYILCINYFGICEDIIISLRKKFKNVIVDNSQAFFSKPFAKSITFYSPRKFFGVPDGGYLYSDLNNKINLDKDLSYNRSLHQLIRLDTEPEIGYKEYLKNEKLFNNLAIKRMSNLTQKILCSINYQKVKRIREENFFYLHERLYKINGINIKTKNVNGPMVYPFRFNDTSLRDSLIQNRIFCGKYWKEVCDRTAENSLESKLSKSIVALPIDQRFSITDMKRIILNIENFINK
jgi:hypothetical protein